MKHSFPSELPVDAQIQRLEDRIDLYNEELSSLKVELSNVRLQLIALHRTLLNIEQQIN